MLFLDRFPIKSLLNRYTAARTPLTLLYWTTHTFSLGVKETYKPQNDSKSVRLRMSHADHVTSAAHTTLSYESCHCIVTMVCQHTIERVR